MDPRQALPRNDPDHRAWKLEAIAQSRAAGRAIRENPQLADPWVNRLVDLIDRTLDEELIDAGILELRMPKRIRPTVARRYMERIRIGASPVLERAGGYVAALGIGGPCIYCGKPATDYDHVWPRARGGTDHSFNIVKACGECNNRKGAKSLLTDACACGRVLDPSDVDCSNGNAFYACRCGNAWSRAWDLQHPVWRRA